jgi:hypothetical protein
MGAFDQRSTVYRGVIAEWATIRSETQKGSSRLCCVGGFLFENDRTTMSVDEPSLIDIISFDPATRETVLTISDHLDWADAVHHQEILQRKLNAYLAFVESGELLEKYPDAEDTAICLKIVLKFKPDQEGLLFLSRAQQAVKLAGFRLEHHLFAESYNN